MSNFAILRFAKLKSSGDIQASAEHSTRDRDTKNADPERRHLNQQLFGDARHLLQNINYLLWQAEQKRKIKPDANLVCEIFLGASPEWFRDGSKKNPINSERVKEFTARCVDFLSQEFGESCVSAVLHLDETTPHIHAHFVPLHRGTQKHKQGGWLSWDDWFGGKIKMQRWQDTFAQYMQPIGLERGIKGSIAAHETIQEFYGRIDQDLGMVPDLEREFTLPVPELEETAEEYHKRLAQQLNQKLPNLQDNLQILAAHAANEVWEKRKAKEATLMNQSLQKEVDEIEKQKRQLEQELAQAAAASAKLKQQMSAQMRDVIAQEMIATAEVVLNFSGKNYLQGNHYTFSRRRGAIKIDTPDGRRLVHNEGGTPKLTEHFRSQDLEFLRKQRQELTLKAEVNSEQESSRGGTGGAVAG
jgi:Plasmid recombination enzyme